MLIKLWQSSATSLFLFQPRLVFLLFRFPSLPLPAAIMCGSTHRGENLWGRITGEHKTPLHYDIATVLQGIDHHWAEIDWLRVGRRNPIWMTVPSHPVSAVLHRTIWWTEQHAAQMCQKGFVVNNNLSRMYFDFSVCSTVFSYLYFSSVAKCQNMLLCRLQTKSKSKLSSTFWLLNPGRCQYSIPATLCHFDTWHHKRMALYRCRHIEYLAEPTSSRLWNIKRRKKSVPSILPFYLLYCCSRHLFPLQTAGKYLMGALIQNRWRRRREGRAGRFVSNRFGQNVSPISRFASVWLPLAKLGEQRNSMNMLSPGIGGMGVWVWATGARTAAISIHQNTWF